MKKLLLLLLLISCKTRERFHFNVCNSITAGKYANSILKKEGLDLNLLKREIKESTNEFIIIYSPKNDNVRGNSAKIKISKNECQIIETKLYQ
ncbi:hypothetical protein [Mesonia aestuariivivens]|uniref:Lipoprotein n=1 Tax=Mesonia aestuariivivens TaxID=2796128 RepID=A0ABS6W291_9FLAO|nr:hypothetical protein [Mesonia aestuariivivens]MBW2961950.1 hypothetical protein [Mesonia aestuariivivens]